MAQCQCLTLQGNRCTRAAVAGSKFCSTHKNCAQSAPTRQLGPPRKTPIKAPKRVSAKKSPASNTFDMLFRAANAPATAQEPAKVMQYRVLFEPWVNTAKPDDMGAVEEDEAGSYALKKKMYQAYQVEFTGKPFFKKDSTEPTTRYVYNYQMPAVTVDLVVFDPTLTKVLLIQRGPTTLPLAHAGKWAIPGGFMEPNETATQAAVREFNEEVSESVKIDPSSIFHVYTATFPDRDPRQRTVSVVFTTVLDPKQVSGKPMDAVEITNWKWMDVLPILQGKTEIAFDHKNLLARALSVHDFVNGMSREERQLFQLITTDLRFADFDKGKKN